MLLQEMLRDPNMLQYSAVVVDEVHERSVNVDLILGFLRNLVAAKEGSTARKHPLKVVVMSATADVEGLVKFFGDSQPVLNTEKTVAKTAKENKSNVSTCYVEGRQYPVKTVYLPQPTQGHLGGGDTQGLGDARDLGSPKACLPDTLQGTFAR